MPGPQCIRYFASTSDGSDGLLALAYVKALLRIAPVRLLSVSGGMGARWQPFSALLMTPMGTPFVNAVCCPPARWAWTQKVSMPNLDAKGLVMFQDLAVERLELYTAGVRNVLLTDAIPDPIRHETAIATALRYQALVVPTDEVAHAWRRVDCHPTVIPVPVTDITAMQAAFGT